MSRACQSGRPLRRDRWFESGSSGAESGANLISWNHGWRRVWIVWPAVQPEEPSNSYGIGNLWLVPGSRML
jgi:hypothetical protein